MVYCTGSHTKYYHRYHIVWVTKYRFNVLQGAMRVRLREIIRQTCTEMGVRIQKGVLSSGQRASRLSSSASLRRHTVWF